MSYHILCESSDSWERSIVYHTQYENYIVFIQQKKNSEKGCWRSIEHCIIPKIFVNFVATLTDKRGSTEDNGTKNCANSWRIQRSSENAPTFLLWHWHTFSKHKEIFVPIRLRLCAYFWESTRPLLGNRRTGSTLGSSTFTNLTSYFTNWITGNKRPEPHCYAGNNRYKTKNSYCFNHGQNFWEYGVNRAVRTQFR